MRLLFHLGVGLIVVMTSGCRLFRDHESESLGKSPLRPANASPDSITMEIIWARFAAHDLSLNETVWRDIDETQFDPAVRRELANNGFRVGVIGGTMPTEIARALDQSPTDETPRGDVVLATDLTGDPIVHGRVQQLRRNQRSEIQASDVYDSLPLLTSGGRELSGRTYAQAQAVYALRVDPLPDRTARVELTPELHHGSPRIRWTRGEDGTGVLHQAPLREREVFNRLRMSVKLAPGEMLVLMSLPDAGSRLASYFHTVESVDGRQQKLILIRLAEVPPSDTFELD